MLQFLLENQAVSIVTIFILVVMFASFLNSFGGKSDYVELNYSNSDPCPGCGGTCRTKTGWVQTGPGNGVRVWENCSLCMGRGRVPRH